MVTDRVHVNDLYADSYPENISKKCLKMHRNRHECGGFGCGYVIHIQANLLNELYCAAFHQKCYISGFYTMRGPDLYVSKSKISSVAGG